MSVKQYITNNANYVMRTINTICVAANELFWQRLFLNTSRQSGGGTATIGMAGRVERQHSRAACTLTQSSRTAATCA